MELDTQLAKNRFAGMTAEEKQEYGLIPLRIASLKRELK